MNVLKGALLFLSGAGVGSGLTYFILKDKLESNKQEEINRIRDYYNEKIERSKKIEKKKEEKQKKKDIKKVDKIITENEYVPYHKMNDKEVKERVRKISEKAIETDIPTEDYPDEPFNISEEEFSEEALWHEKIELDYYLDDGALVNENEELMNIDDCIGFTNLEEFLKDENEGVMYIRNIRLASDYQVTKLSGSYSEIIGLGGDDD